MIPKKLHYVWLGKGEKSCLSNICINSWKEKLPEYQIKELLIFWFFFWPCRL